MKFDLREYQRDCANAVWKGFSTFRRLLAVLPCGAGKTVIASALTNHGPWQPALMLAHRDELITQAAEKLGRFGTHVGVEKAEQSASLDDKIVVASIQTLQNRKRLTKFPPDHFKLVIVDECHHVLSASYLKIINYFESANVLGITATPHRADRRNLGAVFEDTAYEITLFDLIKQGYLCPIKIKTCPLVVTVKDEDGVITDASASTSIEPYLEAVADIVLQHAAKRKTVCFLPLIDTSKRFTKMLQDRGLAAEHIDGLDPLRKEKLAKFSSGEITHLQNSAVLLEGWDEPSVDCIVMLRPTTSQPLFVQAIGRGGRIHPGKEDLLLIDLLWKHSTLKIVRPAHLVAQNDAIAEIMTERAEARATMGETAPEDLEALHRTAVEEREKKLRKELEAKARRAERTVDVMEYALDTKDVSMADFEPTADWETRPASPKQLALLKAFGIDPKSITCAGHAKAIIGKYLYRKKLGLASPKQLALLRKMKHPSPHSATEKEASTWLDKRFGKKS
jgi:superfamily II DNA or RNA helicase